MTNALKSNPLFFDTVGGTSYYPAIGAGSISSVIFGGNLDVDTTILMYDALNAAVNENMEHWAEGTSAAPTMWVLSGAAGTVARDTKVRTVLDGPTAGTYSAKVTRAGTDTFISQNVLKNFDTNDPRSGIAYWKGRYIIGGMWVWASVADRGYVETYDAQTTTTSSAHGGGSGWTWLSTALVAVHSSATELTIRGKVITGNTSVYFDQALIFEAKPLFKMKTTGNAESISYPDRLPFDGLYLETLTGGTLQVQV